MLAGAPSDCARMTQLETGSAMYVTRKRWSQVRIGREISRIQYLAGRIRMGSMTVAIVYEHRESAFALTLEFERRFVAIGWKVTADYKNQSQIRRVGWILPMLEELRQADLIVRVQTEDGVRGLRTGKRHQGLGEELAFLSTSGKPMVHTIVEPWVNMTAEQFDEAFDELVETLLYMQGGHEAVRKWRDKGRD